MSQNKKTGGEAEDLANLLNQVFIIDSAMKKELIQKFPEFSEKKQKHILFVLEKSLEKQNGFVEKALQNNPDLMADIKKGVGEKMKEIRKEEEKKNDTEELEILKQLEQDILKA